ncbi:spindle and kinetochore-associated protein 3 isoform X1 [Ahaetulla prasina]|uniref:spindle and kinetochore-associated protein 3 isoform X1 n=1 Tax=Ahaetulla prasina TaxID=499056 RepID=UPI00264A463A|nr:spindle and kinetochore-associated protein 3 isoform X1 [Ahaetulla prasina]XP_058042316.1 spindle and kinetochore-associated protein 3 isoform X1 [Ahaetulla prasina]
MDVTGTFFNKLRTLAVTLEKQAEQFKQILLENEEFEDDSPMRYLHELYSEARMLKADADNILHTSSSERDATYDFIKASKVLMKRNATNLEKIRDLFQKYGYKPLIGKNEAIKVDDETNAGSALSDQIEPKPLAFPQISSGSHSVLETPQLSDFGLSKYVLPSSSDTVHIPHSQNEEVKVDKSEYLSPKGEYFNIYGRDLSVNDETTNLMDDQTIFLLNKSRKNRSARVMVSDQNLAALRQSNEACDYDCFASPATPEFRTPGVKIPHRKTVLSVSPESNHLEIPPLDTKSQHTQPMHVSATKILPDNHLIKDSVQPVLDSDKYLECTEEPSPPATSIHEDLFNSPLPPPEITVIPKNLLQILSRYNPNIDVPRSAVKGTKEENASQFEKKPFLCTDNKENRKYFG